MKKVGFCGSQTKNLITATLSVVVVVQGNPRVYKALRDQLAAVLGELRRMEAGGGVDGELLEAINLIAKIMEGMKEDTNGR